MAHLIYLISLSIDQTAVYLRPIPYNSGRCVHLRPILSQLSDWLRQITWENKLNLPTNVHRPQMYSCLIGSDRFGLKCTALWLAQTRTIEADSSKMFNFLTFDSNSTSDRFLSDVLKTGQNTDFEMCKVKIHPIHVHFVQVIKRVLYEDRP